MTSIKQHKYALIENDIIDRINSGTLKPGDKVESESVLKKKYGVSTITVRKAFNDLINGGYLYGIQGLGTFVTKQQMVRSLTSVSFFDELVQQGYKLDIVFDGIEEVENPQVAKQMGLDKETKLVCIKRVRLANENPIAYHISYFVSENLDEKTTKEIRKSNSLYRVLKKKNLYPTWVNEKYSVKEIKDEKICRYLKVKKGYPSFHVERTSFNDTNEIIEYAYTYFNKDWYSVSVNIKA